MAYRIRDWEILLKEIYQRVKDTVINKLDFVALLVRLKLGCTCVFSTFMPASWQLDLSWFSG